MIEVILSALILALCTAPIWPVWAEIWRMRKRRLAREAKAREVHRKEWLHGIQALGLKESDYPKSERPR